MLNKVINFIKNNWYIPVVVLSVIAINMFICRVGMVVGPSMSPTLRDGSPMLISLNAKIDRKDVIVFEQEGESRYLVKRIIGMPGETIQIKNNVIYIDGEPLTDVVAIEMENYGIAAEPVTLGENEYFVMGDNRNNSSDSRVFGAISGDDILGEVVCSLLPVKKII